MKVTAVVVAAGSSRRMGRDKLWIPLSGHPVARYCLTALQSFEEVFEIILVTREDSFGDFRALAEEAGVSKLRSIVAGGKERQDSVWNGLQPVSPEADLVLVHDAARPLLCRDIFEPTARAAQECGAAVCGSPVVDTIKEVDENGFVLRTPARASLMAVQTPQIFHRSVIVEAYRRLMAEGRSVTDDTAAAESLGCRVRVVTVAAPNIKITHPDDIPFVEQLLARRV